MIPYRKDPLILTFGEYLIALRCQEAGKPIPFSVAQIEATNRALAEAEVKAKTVKKKHESD